tara:strand:+ start:396 stop:635 length:240 start_codon:yes stop_codon:yes gene_type:complete
MSDYWQGLLEYEKKDTNMNNKRRTNMNDRESKQLDVCLAILSMASAKGADPTDMLNAFAFDMNLIRNGENPTETQKLIE